MKGYWIVIESEIKIMINLSLIPRMSRLVLDDGVYCQP